MSVCCQQPNASNAKNNKEQVQKSPSFVYSDFHFVFVSVFFFAVPHKIVVLVVIRFS